MRSLKIITFILVLFGFTFMGFQCGSTELTSAKLYIQQKNFDKALEVLQDEVQKNPQSDEGYYLLGYVYGEKGQYSKMMDAFDKSVSISKNFENDIKSSRIYYWANLFNNGVKEYQAGVNAQDKDSNKVYLEKAAQSFGSAIKIEPDSIDTYKNLAFVYMNQGDMDGAVDPLKVVINKEHSLDGYKYLGEILYQKGVKQRETDSVVAMKTFNETIQVLEDGRKYYPNNEDILVTLSNAYIAANKLDVAMDVFKAGAEAQPNNKFYHYDYGVLLLDAEQYEAAEKQFHKAVELDSIYENAIYNLGVTYIKWGTSINKAAEEKGDTTSTYREKYQMALPYMEKVAQMRPKEASVWELLGRVYTVLGMNDDATNAFKKADSLRQ
jgi:tetratricopeptide (TPR) repeat protein